MATTPTIPERPGAITFKGSPMTLMGHALQVGDTAPEFALAASDMTPTTWETLSNHGQKAVLMILIPSIDTSI